MLLIPKPQELAMLDLFTQQESNVRGYVRLFPTVFDRSVGSELWDTDEKRFIDFFCGAGSLNYGHNNPLAKAAILKYVEQDGIQHSLDTATKAKAHFLSAFQHIILAPRQLNYRLQFTGPTGTNAVEAAIKLARKKTRRSHVIGFTHAYHGHTLGALALTANSYYHDEHYGARNNVSHFPYDGYCKGVDSAALLAQFLDDPSSGVPKPAAIVVETVQGEGGINVASSKWLRDIEAICRKHECLLIVDDIQVGNGRTGKFFSFEDSGIEPDLVCLSKSLGGGLPLSLVLVHPQCDQWNPGEHTGTFRGNNLAFVAAAELLNYWTDSRLQERTIKRESSISQRLEMLISKYPSKNFSVRGRGMILGIDLADGELARSVIDRCFADGLLIESSGANDEVLKVMPALTITDALLNEGLEILEHAVSSALSNAPNRSPIPPKSEVPLTPALATDAIYSAATAQAPA